MSGREQCIGNPVAEVIWLDDTQGGAALPPQSGAYLSIQNVAAMFGVTTWTLRYYELRGIIGPRQRVAGHWVYSWADCDRIAFIVKCRRVGIGLADIAPILAAADHEVPAKTIRAHQLRCEALIENLEQPRKVYDDAIFELKQLHALLDAKLIAGDK
jgi:DNA-binding transcriptional MerR regulator